MKTFDSSLNNPLWTAMITPMTASGEPDLAAMERLLRDQEVAGNGVLILGSTGEALNLVDSERRQVVELTTSLNLDIPVMAGVGGHSLPDVMSWLTYLEDKKIDAYLMVTPLYAKPGPEGQYHWFKTLMDFVSRPVMVYNIPGRTGTALHLNAVERLRDHRNFWAIKEASGSVSDFCEYKANAGEVILYSGDDAMLPEFAPHGAIGAVSVAGNVWPEATRLYSEMAVNSELTKKDLDFWKKVSKSLFVASNPVPVKALMYTDGRITSPEVRLPLHRDDMHSLDDVCEISRQVSVWHKKKLQAGVAIG
ncbi:MAG: 4-hydroxy-tetrahydrodipicolinate synthase [Balneolales bacterium]